MRRTIVILAALGGVGILLTCTWAWGMFFRPLPSDDTLHRQFQAHREDLEALAAIALADTLLVGAGHDPMLMRFTVFVRDSPRFNRMLTDGEVRGTGRFELRERLDRVGLPAISRAGDGSFVWFVVRSNVHARKGIVYSEKPLKPVRASLDGLDRASFGDARHGYVALAPRWFLFLEPRDYHRRRSRSKPRRRACKLRSYRPPRPK